MTLSKQRNKEIMVDIRLHKHLPPPQTLKPVQPKGIESHPDNVKPAQPELYPSHNPVQPKPSIDADGNPIPEFT